MEIDSYLVFGTYIPNLISKELFKIVSCETIDGLEDANDTIRKKFGLEILEINYPIGITENNFHIEQKYFLNIILENCEGNILSLKKLRSDNIDDKIETFKRFCETLSIKTNGPMLFSIPYVRYLSNITKETDVRKT